MSDNDERIAELEAELTDMTHRLRAADKRAVTWQDSASEWQRQAEELQAQLESARAATPAQVDGLRNAAERWRKNSKAWEEDAEKQLNRVRELEVELKVAKEQLGTRDTVREWKNRCVALAEERKDLRERLNRAEGVADSFVEREQAIGDEFGRLHATIEVHEQTIRDLHESLRRAYKRGDSELLVGECTVPVELAMQGIDTTCTATFPVYMRPSDARITMGDTDGEAT